MTDYHYVEVIVYDSLGGVVRSAANVRSVTVADPATGLTPTLTQAGTTVLYLTADSRGLATFTASCDTALVDFGAGPVTAISTERLAAALTGGAITVDGGTL